MPTITLSTKTQAAINTALSNPGVNNQNYLNAYNDIAADITAAGEFNSGTVNWFSQVGLVNTQLFNATAPGTFIYTYTKAAAASEGVTITNNELQTVSNTIATTVFASLKNNNFSFSDSSPGLNFSPTSIVQDDAGAGLSQLNQLTNSNMDGAIWGGTLFARTELQDSNYFPQEGLTLTPGSIDCTAILAGFAGTATSMVGAIANNPSLARSALQGISQLDTAAMAQCFPIPTSILGVNGTTISDNNSNFTINFDSTLANQVAADLTSLTRNPAGDLYRTIAPRKFSSGRVQKAASAYLANTSGGRQVRRSSNATRSRTRCRPGIPRSASYPGWSNFKPATELCSRRVGRRW
jgi:hypothetical protein